MTSRPPRTLCLGDALVDLVGERSAAPLTEIGRFSPHFGGAAANVALVSGVQTPLTFVTVNGDGEPSYHLHGEQPDALLGRS